MPDGRFVAVDLIIKQIYTMKFSQQLTLKTKKIKNGRVIIECKGKMGVVGTIILNKINRGVMSRKEYLEHLEDAD